MEGKLHLSLVAGIILSFLQAPFLHVHDRDREHQHAHGFAHWFTEHGSGPNMASQQDASEARLLHWMPGDGNPPIRLDAEMPDEISIPEFVAQPALVTEFNPRSHDPPWRLALKSRAPPA